jgi:hypothetical protein
MATVGGEQLLKFCKHCTTVGGVCRYTAAASRPMLLKQCLQLPKPLWKEVLEFMGGEYAIVAEKADQYEF